jgi:ribonuclease VapC
LIAIDSSALVAILLDEPEADPFMHIINEASLRLVSSVSWLETSMVLAGRGNSNDDDAWLEFDAFVARASIQIVAHDDALSKAARDAFLRYGRGRHPAALNLGDCAAYALAKTRGLPLLFKGQDFSKTDLVPAA